MIYAHFYCENLIYALFPHPESFCAINTAIRKVFDFSVSALVPLTLTNPLIFLELSVWETEDTEVEVEVTDSRAVCSVV